MDWLAGLGWVTRSIRREGTIQTAYMYACVKQGVWHREKKTRRKTCPLQKTPQYPPRLRVQKLRSRIPIPIPSCGFIQQATSRATRLGPPPPMHRRGAGAGAIFRIRRFPPQGRGAFFPHLHLLRDPHDTRYATLNFYVLSYAMRRLR